MSLLDDIKNAAPEALDDLKKRELSTAQTEWIADREWKEEAVQRLRRKIKEQLHAEAHPPQQIPAPRKLSERLSVKRSPIVWRIVDWQKIGSRVLLAEQFKAGKTTLVTNIVRSLVDAAPFLDKFDVSPVQMVTVLDFEMAEDEPNQLDEWYDAAHIKHTDRVQIVALRGRASSFNILDPEVRARWAATLHGTEYLVVDCLRPILDAIGLDENHEVGRFFVALDALLNEAGIRDALVVHHMGHQNERARGDSRNLDWPDAIWTLVRESDDPASRRFIKAFGRGIDVPETALNFNPKTHRMGIGHGSRKDAKVEEVIPAILAFVGNATSPPTQSAIRKAMKEEGFSDDRVRAAIKKAVKRGDLSETSGTKNQKVYSNAVPF